MALCLFPLFAHADLEVHFLDVGYGECTIIVCDGAAAIIDGGDASHSDVVYDAINEMGISEIEFMIATTAKDEYVGGLPAVFHAVPVGALYVPTTSASDCDRHGILINTAQEHNVEASIPEDETKLPLGSATITIMHPAVPGGENCLIVLVEHKRTSILFCSDAGYEIENELNKFASYNIHSVDVLVVGKHGQDGATGEKFLFSVFPQYAIIFCEDPPSSQTLEVLHNRPSRPVRTDINGSITLTSDGWDYSIIAERHYVGNSSSHIVHLPSCTSAESINPKHVSILFSVWQAQWGYYRPCKKCDPWIP